MSPPLPVYQPADEEHACDGGGDASLVPKTITVGGIEPLINFEEAARILRTKERTLREIVRQSRNRIEGRPFRGPTIRFFQLHPKAAIKFRREWLEEFIREHTHDPTRACFPSPEERHPKKKEHGTVGYGTEPGNSEPSLGFDSHLYDV